MPRREIIAYNRTWYWLYFIGFAWETLGLSLLLAGRVGVRLRDSVERRTRFRPLQVAIFYAIYSMLLLAWNLPLAWIGPSVRSDQAKLIELKAEPELATKSSGAN